MLKHRELFTSPLWMQPSGNVVKGEDEQVGSPIALSRTSSQGVLRRSGFSSKSTSFASDDGQATPGSGRRTSLPRVLHLAPVGEESGGYGISGSPPVESFRSALHAEGGSLNTETTADSTAASRRTTGRTSDSEVRESYTSLPVRSPDAIANDDSEVMLPDVMDTLPAYINNDRRSIHEKHLVRRGEAFAEFMRHMEAEGRALLKWEDFAAFYPNYPTMDDVELTEEDRDMDLDISPYMNTAALTIHHSTHVDKVQHLFRALGLRHLTVVNSTNQVVGILTRADLLDLEHELHDHHLHNRGDNCVDEVHPLELPSPISPHESDPVPV